MAMKRPARPGWQGAARLARTRRQPSDASRGSSAEGDAREEEVSDARGEERRREARGQRPRGRKALCV